MVEGCDGYVVVIVNQLRHMQITGNGQGLLYQWIWCKIIDKYPTGVGKCLADWIRSSHPEDDESQNYSMILDVS